MALLSPGTEIKVIDESVYVPGEPGTIPFIAIATGTDKQAASGSSIAEGTLAANAGKLWRVGSQKELTELFGVPNFQVDAFNTVVQGSEISEYGLFAAYSYLGLSNSVYVQRANIDLNQLAGSSTPPVGNPVNGTYWLDLNETMWGLFEWSDDNQVFYRRTPKIITDSAFISGGTPISSYGLIGDYAVNATSTENGLFYKATDNVWYKVGSNTWREKWATVRSSATVTTITSGVNLIINGETVTTVSTALKAGLVDVINANAILIAAKITAAVVNSKLEIYSENLDVAIGSGSDNTLVSDLKITEKTYYKPVLTFAKHTQIPLYYDTDATPRPNGSIWMKTTNPNYGAKFVVKKYDTVAGTWETMTAPLFANNADAITFYQGAGDASDVVTSVLYVQYDVDGDSTGTFRLNYWEGETPLVVTGTDLTPTVTSGDAFSINGTTVTIAANTVAGFISAVSAANISNVYARQANNGAMEIVNEIGEDLVLAEVTNTPLAAAGFSVGRNSNWSTLTYEASLATPSDVPATDTLWYDTNVSQVDIMQHNGTTWKGYKNIAGNASTDPNGAIVSASQPTEQSDGTSLVVNDVWIDTSDLDNYPKIYVYDGSVWNQINNTDQTTMDGIIFADARINSTGEITGSAETADLLTSDYLDPDAPDPALYPRGMLLFNTRVSGFVVRRFKKDYINATDFPDGNERMNSSLPTYRDRWILDSGKKANGALYGGRKAQRASVVKALQGEMASSLELRDPAKYFNLIAAPGYPELLDEMINLNVERKETAFIIADTPMRLENNTTEIENWVLNSNNAEAPGEDGLVKAYTYSAIYYPSGYATDLTGANVAVPASHAMLRTYAYNDAVSEQWFAPAGLRRGILNNLANVGYVDSQEGEFVPVGLSEGQKDTLYANKVNPLVFIPGSGLVAMGQKTLHPYTSALDRVNVARLICYMRRQLDILSRPFLFEPNDKITRNEIKGVVDRFCNDLVTRRALYDYLVVCDESNNPPVKIDKNELWVDIAIEPVKAVEFIYIPIRIKATGTIRGAQGV